MATTTKIAKGTNTKALENAVLDANQVQSKNEMELLECARSGDAVSMREYYEQYGKWGLFEKTTENADVMGFSALTEAHFGTCDKKLTTEELSTRIVNSLKQGKAHVDTDACYLLAERKAKSLVYKLGLVDRTKRQIWANAYGYDELAQIGVLAILEQRDEIKNGKKTPSQAVGYYVAKAINPNKHYSDMLIIRDTSNDLAYARKVVRECTNLEYSIWEDSQEIKALCKVLKQNKCLQALKVLELIGYGYNNREIAKILKIHEVNVGNHVKTIQKFAKQVK